MPSTASHLTKPSDLDENRKISTESNFSISENYSSLPSVPSSVPTEQSDTGGALHRVLTNQLYQADQADEQLRKIEAYESKQFLSEMRQIQKTGKKAAEIMLKASKNLAAQADVSIPTTSAISSTPTASGNV